MMNEKKEAFKAECEYHSLSKLIWKLQIYQSCRYLIIRTVVHAVEWLSKHPHNELKVIITLSPQIGSHKILKFQYAQYIGPC